MESFIFIHCFQIVVVADTSVPLTLPKTSTARKHVSCMIYSLPLQTYESTATIHMKDVLDVYNHIDVVRIDEQVFNRAVVKIETLFDQRL